MPLRNSRLAAAIKIYRSQVGPLGEGSLTRRRRSGSGPKVTGVTNGDRDKERLFACRGKRENKKIIPTACDAKFSSDTNAKLTAFCNRGELAIFLLYLTDGATTHVSLVPSNSATHESFIFHVRF